MPRTGPSTSRRMIRIYPSILQFFSSRFLACFALSPYRESEAECRWSCWIGRCSFISNRLHGNRDCTLQMKATHACLCSISLDLSDGFLRGLLPIRAICVSEMRLRIRLLPNALIRCDLRNSSRIDPVKRRWRHEWVCQPGFETCRSHPPQRQYVRHPNVFCLFYLPFDCRLLAGDAEGMSREAAGGAVLSDRLGGLGRPMALRAAPSPPGCCRSLRPRSKRPVMRAEARALR